MHMHRVGPEQADPILLLHGGGFTGRSWQPVVEYLPDYRLLIPDLPGHGSSAGEDFVSIERAADGLQRLLGRENARGPVHVVGVSLGAYIGLLLSLQHVDCVARAVLTGFHVGNMPNPRLMRIMGDAMSPLAASSWFRRFNAKALNVPAETLESLEGDDPRTTARTVRAVNRAAVDFDVTGDLGRLSTPTLALAGGREHATILESLRILEQRAPACTTRIAPGLGHAWPLQDPKLFADTVRAWVRQKALPAALQPVPPALAETA